MHLATAAEMDENFKLFASRRQMDMVRLAVDGTHTPFFPLDASTAEDYKNYKYWHSMLTLAFVNPAYMFEEAEIGWPGRNGDPTILANSWIKWARTGDCRNH